MKHSNMIYFWLCHERYAWRKCPWHFKTNLFNTDDNFSNVWKSNVREQKAYYSQFIQHGQQFLMCSEIKCERTKRILFTWKLPGTKGPVMLVKENYLKDKWNKYNMLFCVVTPILSRYKHISGQVYLTIVFGN